MGHSEDTMDMIAERIETQKHNLEVISQMELPLSHQGDSQLKSSLRLDVPLT
jgi:hypothetical protein